MKTLFESWLFGLWIVALLNCSSAFAAGELWVVKDGVLDKEALAPRATDNNYCSGKTVGGFHVTGPGTLSRLRLQRRDCAAGRLRGDPLREGRQEQARFHDRSRPADHTTEEVEAACCRFIDKGSKCRRSRTCSDRLANSTRRVFDVGLFLR